MTTKYTQTRSATQLTITPKTQWHTDVITLRCVRMPYPGTHDHRLDQTWPLRTTSAPVQLCIQKVTDTGAAGLTTSDPLAPKRSPANPVWPQHNIRTWSSWQVRRPHLESYANFNRYQSAYRRRHSTETTLLRVLDDVYHAADNHSRSLLLQLDLSAAFDTLDKPTLLRRLNHTFSVSSS